MAGIGVKLNRIYEKNTITTNLVGFGYSLIMTVAPMFLIILSVFLVGKIVGLSTVGYAQRELLSGTTLYIFIFSMLVTTPFNAILSRYLADVIYEEQYDDIQPCFHVGLLMNVVLGAAVGVPFCIRQYMIGQTPLHFVFTGFCAYMALILVFYAMLFLSACKDYQKIFTFFLAGSVTTIVLSLLLNKGLGWEPTYTVLLSLAIGFLVTASLELTLVRCYFKRNSGKYGAVLQYFIKYWKLSVTNLLFTLGMYIHNMVFWNSDMGIVVNGCFYSAGPYDMATCLAMFTNITSTVIFMSRVEMHFHAKYKAYSEAVIGGRLMDIENAKKRMFRQLSTEIMNLVRIQFIISVIIYLLCIIFLPQLGFSGLTLQIYPCLAAGYFILFIMYAAMIFLFYFNDVTGSLLTTTVFCATVLVGSMIAMNAQPIWYGMGVVAGGFTGWCVAYLRLRWVERNLDVHIFCNGHLMKKGRGAKPAAKVMG